MTLADLSVLTPMRRLRSLDIKLGGTKDLNLLPQVGRIEYLELWMIRGLSDISVVADMPSLRYLFLQGLKNVEHLPSLGACRRLVGVHLETMKGLRDLAPLRDAPALEQLMLIDMGHLTIDDLRPLANHPTLRQATTALGSKRRYEAASALLGLPRVEFTRPWSELIW